LELSPIGNLHWLAESRRGTGGVQADDVVYRLNVLLIEGIEHIAAELDSLTLSEFE
jgi:hypothetical protein